MGSRVTLKDITQRAGCSVAVASSVLNGSNGSVRYSQEVARKVKEAATELGYQRPSRQRREQRGSTIAFVGHQYSMGMGDLYGSFMSEFSRQLSRCGYAMEMIFADDPFRVRGLSEKAKNGQISGVISFVMSPDFHHEVCDASGIPVVHVNPYDLPDSNGILPDDAAGTEQAVKYLVSLGVKRIYYRDTTTPHMSAAIRRDALASNCDDYGIEILGLDDSKHCDIMALVRAVEQGAEVIVNYASISLDSIHDALAKGGYSIPDDVGLLCLSEVRNISPELELTSLETPFDLMGRAAADMIIDLATHNQMTFDNIFIPSRLNIGSSCLRPVKRT